MSTSWNLREIVLVAVLAVVFGILYLWWIPVGALAAGIGGPVAREPLFGFWLLAAVVAGYIVQKPGAALFAELVAAFTEMLAGSSGGLIVLAWGFVQGIGIEAVFLATGYRNFSLPVMMLAGAVSGALAFGWQWLILGYSQFNPVLVAAMFVLRVLSGAFLAGVGGKLIAEALAATGVLNGFALGQQWLQKRRAAVEG
jgi:energy-coupling factor transport system substrate-specific component